MSHPELSFEAARALAVLEAGGYIEARRTFPRPHVYWLTRPNGSRYAQPLAVATVEQLVRERRITPTPAGDPGNVDSYDTIHYRVRAVDAAAH